MFDQYGSGGADRQWLTITIYLYNIGWGQKNFGRAAALAWILFLIILAHRPDQPLVTRGRTRRERRRRVATGRSRRR